MKKLTTADGFAFCRLITKSNMRDDLKRIVNGVGASADVRDVGMETVFTIIEALSSKGEEQAIYEFLSKPFEMPAAAIADLDLIAFGNALKELAELNDLKNFFGFASNILGKS